MSKPPTFAALQAIATNARTRKRWEEFSVALEILYVRLSFAYVRAVCGAGLELPEDSPVVRYGDEAALSWRPDAKPLEELNAELAASIEAMFTGLMEAEDLLSAYLESQEALRRLQLRQAAGKQ